MKKKTYTVNEVADVLAYHRGTVMDFLRKGRIKGMKLGSQWRVTEEEIRRVLGLQEDQPRGSRERPQENRPAPA